MRTRGQQKSRCKTLLETSAAYSDLTAAERARLFKSLVVAASDDEQTIKRLSASQSTEGQENDETTVVFDETDILRAENKSLRDAVEEMERKLQKTEESCRVLSSRRSEVEARATAQRESLEQLQKVLTETQNSHLEMERILTETKKSLGASRTNAEHLQKALASVAAKNEILKKEVHECRKQCAAGDNSFTGYRLGVQHHLFIFRDVVCSYAQSAATSGLDFSRLVQAYDVAVANAIRTA